MSKAELIDAIAKSASLKRADARKFLDAFVEVASTSLIKGEEVIVFRFGTFSIIEKVARTGRNPLTGESLDIPAKKVVRFRPSSNLSAKVK
ncbi:MAG: HU family DNA-binding protein [Prevotellaceae bacterium]|jgi:DNA-binding protein HU-beta|nr:HU family DNA-binding protein [Prevotellaceae bacterium]